MTPSLSEFLTERHADSETIQQAARYVVAELSDDLSAAEMLDELRGRLADPGQAQSAVDELRSAPDELTQNALWVLSRTWYDLDERDMVTAAVTNAQTKLPVLEIAVIAASVLYGLHLIMTKGVKRTYRKVERRSDGSYTETTTEYYTPASALPLVTQNTDPAAGPKAEQ